MQQSWYLKGPHKLFCNSSTFTADDLCCNGNLYQFIAGETKVKTFREIPSERSIGMLITPSLPGECGSAKWACARVLLDLFKSGELAAILYCRGRGELLGNMREKLRAVAV